MIYTNKSSWQATGNTLEFAAPATRCGSPTGGSARPLVPAGSWAGNGWSVWQYTSSGSVKGIKGNVDLNRLGPAGLAPITVP